MTSHDEPGASADENAASTAAAGVPPLPEAMRRQAEEFARNSETAVAVAEPATDDAGPLTEKVTEAAPEKPKRSIGRRITLWFGVAMILAGLSLLGYIAWELWGTNIISKREQREITSQLERDWANGTGCTVHCPEGKASALIRIPKFGKKYVVPVLEGAPDGTISSDILAKGYGHFATTADPGQIGNYAIAAHRVTHGEPLRHMPDLRPGDKVIVETRHFTYVYRLDTNPNDLVISFTGVWVLDALPHNPDGGVPDNVQFANHRLITLTTCSEIFHTDNRMIAFGHLDKVFRKTGVPDHPLVSVTPTATPTSTPTSTPTG